MRKANEVLTDFVGARGVHTPIETRIAAQVRPDGECLMWAGSTNGRYAVIGRSGRHAYVHRVVWELANGPIPAGLVIDHVCSRPLCVNPRHLRVVTQRENVLAGRNPNVLTHLRGVCKRGHSAEMYRRRDRHCQRCATERERERKTTDPDFLARRRESWRRQGEKRKAARAARKAA